MADQLSLPRATDANNDPVAGALCYVYEAGTSTPKDTYSDVDLATLHATPIEADGEGVFPPVFLSGAAKVDVQTPGGASLPGYPRDNFPATSTTGGAAQLVSYAPQEGNAATNVQDAIDNTVYRGSSVGPVATTSGTSVSFTDIPAGVMTVEIEFLGNRANGTSQTVIELGDSDGLETTGYNQTHWHSTDGAGTNTGAFIVDSNGFAIYGTFVLRRFPGTDRWTASYTMRAGNSDIVAGGGSKALSGELTQIRVRSSAHTFDAGAIGIVWKYS